MCICLVVPHKSCSRHLSQRHSAKEPVENTCFTCLGNPDEGQGQSLSVGVERKSQEDPATSLLGLWGSQECELGTYGTGVWEGTGAFREV